MTDSDGDTDLLSENEHLLCDEHCKCPKVKKLILSIPKPRMDSKKESTKNNDSEKENMNTELSLENEIDSTFLLK